MSVIQVVDEHDTTDNTAFVNRLHDLNRGRLTVHAPTAAEGLAGEVLRALDRHPHRENEPPNASRKELLAEVWLRAERAINVFVYGAWRLSDEHTQWLTQLGQTPTITVWLITHADTRNAAATRDATELGWTFEMFRQHWNRKRRRTRKPARYSALTLSNWDRTPVPEPVDFGPKPMAPWPYALPLHLAGQVEGQGRLHTAYRVLRSSRLPTSNTDLAALIVRWFETWTTPQQRSWLLCALRDFYFKDRETWLEWEPGLLDVDVLPDRSRNDPPFNHVDEPEIALKLVVSTLTRYSSCDERVVLVAPDASRVLLPGGEQVNLPNDCRPIARAYLRLQEFRSQHDTIKRIGSRYERTPEDEYLGSFAQDRFTEIAAVCRRIQLWPINTNVFGGRSRLNVREPLPDAEGMLDATYRQVTLLRRLAAEPSATPNRGPAIVSAHDTVLSDVRQLARGGMVVRRENGDIALSDWLESHWVHGRLKPISGMRSNRPILRHSDPAFAAASRRVLTVMKDPRANAVAPLPPECGLLPRTDPQALLPQIGALPALANGELTRPPDNHLLDFMVRTEILDAAYFEESTEVALALMYHPAANTIVHVTDRAPCDFCGEPARYDARVDTPPSHRWAWLCEQCYLEHSDLRLGSGHGRYVVAVDELSPEIKQRFRQARVYWSANGVPRKLDLPWSETACATAVTKPGHMTEIRRWLEASTPR